MRGSPIQNFICVLTLLTVMGIGVFMTTRNVEAVKPEQEAIHTNTSADSKQITVEAEILFSHRPTHIKIQQSGNTSPNLDLKPASNEIDFTLKLPAQKNIEFLIDIQWPEESDDSKYFTQITLRQDGTEDQVILFSDQFADFSDTFSVDTL